MARQRTGYGLDGILVRKNEGNRAGGHRHRGMILRMVERNYQDRENGEDH